MKDTTSVMLINEFKSEILWNKAKRYSNLTFVPVVSKSTELPSDLVDMEIANESTQGIHISELDQEDVNNVIFESKEKKTMLVVSGIILEGGRQTRTTTRPFIIAKKKKMKIPVNCVEQRRWSYTEKNRVAEDERDFKFSTRHVSRKTKASFASGGYSQSATWGSISNMRASSGVAMEEAPTESYLEVEEKMMERSKEKVDEIKSKIEDVFRVEHQQGILIFEDDKLDSIELFQSNKHWESIRENILETSIPDLLAEEETASEVDLDELQKVFEQIDFEYDKEKPLADEESEIVKGTNKHGWRLSYKGSPVYLTVHEVDEEQQISDFVGNIQQQQRYMRVEEIELPEEDVEGLFEEESKEE
ncbi:MAG: hypothetical protein INQ03_25060 [Candidatus Heimdallarchaeota archaeon]|nr:hypothetical protein [Candidatus Heimdallarchaeota archaeon]